MSLPIDIPWKRMGVSKDMIDEKVEDYQNPEKWNSSIAVFYHELAQDQLPPDYCNRKITYLKIICTLTNFQLPMILDSNSNARNPIEEDISILNELRKKYSDFYAWDVFERKVTESFPCYGALLQVGVYPYPKNKKIELHNYPYISAFQPRKREMYEMISQSGETLSQSATAINASKSGTNTKSTEDYDIETSKGGGGQSLGFLGYFGEQQSTGQWGTVNRDENVNQMVTNKDASREKRESHSYTTNINQLYCLLQGYHLGTNRAIFFLQPRPHIQDIKFTFIHGLRRLEGIQEFFLIVNRPASVPGLCVDITLETAHLSSRRGFSPRLVSETIAKTPENLDKTMGAIGDEGFNLRELFSYEFDLVNTWNSATSWQRFTAIEYAEKRTIPETQALIMGSEGNIGVDQLTKLVNAVHRVPNIQSNERMGLLFDEYETTSGDMFITSRRLCTCAIHEETEEEVENNNVPPKNTDNQEESTQDTIYNVERSNKFHISTCEIGTGIIYEKELRPPIYTSQFGWIHPIIMNTQTEIASTQNAFIDNINHELKRSIGSLNRYKFGEISLLGTKFMLKEIKQLIRLAKKIGINDKPIENVVDLKSVIGRGLGQRSGIKNVFDLGTLSTKMLAKDLNISELEAQKEIKKILITALKALDEKTINLKANQVHPIIENLAFEYPSEKFNKLIDSALINNKKSKSR